MQEPHIFQETFRTIGTLDESEVGTNCDLPGKTKPSNQPRRLPRLLHIKGSNCMGSRRLSVVGGSQNLSHTNSDQQAETKIKST